MKTNKSIDGLTLRDAGAKKPPVPKQPKQVFNNQLAKPTKKPAVKKQSAKSHSVTPQFTKSAPVKTKPSPAPIIKPVSELEVEAKIEEIKNELSPNNKEQTVEDFLKPVQAFDFDGSTGELKASKNNNKEKSKKIRSKSNKKLNFMSNNTSKKPSKKRRIITTIALVIVLGLIGLVSWAVFWGNDIIAKITGGQGNVFDLIKFVEPTYEPLKTDSNNRTNILAFGTSGYDMSGDEGNGVHAGAQLTDSIMVISLNQDTGDVAMISLPRDLKASPTCTATGKINEIYWCNGGGYDISTEQELTAASALMDEVGSILNLDFQYFAHLNWGSLITVVDILDGIDVVLDENINDEWWTGAVYEAGVSYHLSGEEALGLARARHGTAGGDFSRGASQQKILIGIKDKFLAKDNLSITDFLSLASTLGDNFRSNFSIDELKSLAHLTFNFNFDDMRQLSLWPDYMTTGSLDNGISYVFPRAGVDNYGAIQEYVTLHLSNDPRTYEAPIIAILNATGETGVASTEATKLEEENYQITTIDNAPEDFITEDLITIYYNENKKGTKTMLEKRYTNGIFEPITTAPENISRDYDFIIILGPSPAPESTESESTPDSKPSEEVTE